MNGIKGLPKISGHNISNTQQWIENTDELFLPMYKNSMLQ